jgi:hypothetical protein
MTLHIKLPSGQGIDCPASAARLTSSAGSLTVERPATSEVLYASAPEADLTVGEGGHVRYFRLGLMHARLTPVEWTFLAEKVTELAEAPAGGKGPSEVGAHDPPLT